MDAPRNEQSGANGIKMKAENIDIDIPNDEPQITEEEVFKAAMAGSKEVIKKYLSQSKQPQIDGGSSELPLTRAGNSILHIHVTAPISSGHTNDEFINFVVGRDDSLVRSVNKYGETPLHLAASSGQIRAVELFIQVQIQNRASLLLMTNNAGDTALHMAVRNNHVKVVSHLLSLSDQRTQYPANAAGETPLFLAAETGRTRLLQLVLDRTEIPQEHMSRETALHSAVLWSNSEMVEMIIKRHPKLINVKDHGGQTPLHCAAAMECRLILELLLSESDCYTAAYTQDREGRTAAHIAAQRSNLEGLEVLLNYFPGCFELVDCQGRNAVHYAASLGHNPRTVDYFLKDFPFSHLLNQPDNNGDKPLDLMLASTPQENYIEHYKFLSWLRTIPSRLRGERVPIYFYATLMVNGNQITNPLRAPIGGQSKHWLPNLEEEKSKLAAYQKEEDAGDLGKTAEQQAVVSALIATVSFAAGLAVPGGCNQNTGIATLINDNTNAFRLFFITDVCAFFSSLLALLLYSVVFFQQLKKRASLLLNFAFTAHYISLGSLLSAFYYGAYAAVSTSKHLKLLLGVMFWAFQIPYTLIIIYWCNAEIRTFRNFHGRYNDLTQIRRTQVPLLS